MQKSSGRVGVGTHVVTSVSASGSTRPPGSPRPVGERRHNSSKYVRRISRAAELRDRVRADKVSSSAARQPDRPKTRRVAFQRATEKVTGFLALPRDSRRHRAIIVIHEWWGLNEWVKEQAVKLATNGYVALAVDLYHGKVTADPSEARKLKRGLRQERAIGDLKAAFDYLADRPDVDPKQSARSGGPWAAVWRFNSQFMSRGFPRVS